MFFTSIRIILFFYFREKQEKMELEDKTVIKENGCVYIKGIVIFTFTK